MPRPRLKTRSISSSATPPASATTPKIARLRPRSPADLGAEPLGQHPGEVPGDPAPGDVGEGVDLDVAGQATQGRRVDDARPDQLLAQRHVGSRPGRLVQPAVARLDQDLPGQRVPVRPQAGAGDPHHTVTGPDAPGEPPVRLDDAHGETHEIELPRLHHPGVLGDLAADEGTARLDAAVPRPRSRSPRSWPGRCARPRCSRGRTAARRRTRRGRRPTWRRSRARSCRSDRRGGRPPTSSRHRRSWRRAAAGGTGRDRERRTLRIRRSRRRPPAGPSRRRGNGSGRRPPRPPRDRRPPSDRSPGEHPHPPACQTQLRSGCSAASGAPSCELGSPASSSTIGTGYRPVRQASQNAVGDAPVAATRRGSSR